jgi:hypothetical protein
MKRISLLAILIFITGIMFSCSDSSSSDTEEGYIDPGLTAKTIALKSYDFNGANLNTYSCMPASTACGAIIFSGELNDTDYVGFAAGKDVSFPNFSLKIYWSASSIPTSISTSSYTVVINDATGTYTSTTDPLNATISSGAGTYTITFTTNNIIVWNSAHTLSKTIAIGDTIVAYPY